MGINRSRHTDKLLGALDVIGFAVCCCSVGAERHFGLHTGHYLLRGLLLFSSGGTPFSFCTLDIVCFAVSCCPAVAYRHFILRLGHYSLRGLLLPGGGISPFCSAHWTLLASRSLVARWWHIAILLCTLDIVCFAVFCCPGGGISPFCFAHWTLLASRTVVTRQWHIAILFCALDILCFAIFRNPAIGGAPGVREQQETCESQKHPVGKNQKRSAGGVHEVKKFAKQNKINEPNGVAICHERKTKETQSSIFQD